MTIGSITPRTRRVVSDAGPAQTAAAPSTGGWMKTGGDARAAAEAELARQKEIKERRDAGIGYMPFRFFCRQGEQREIIVLDADLGVRFYEHHMKNHRTGKWDIYEGCPKDWDHCPLCETDKESYFVMLLTIIDLTPYTNQKGETFDFSRKLLAVKAGGQGFFQRTYDREGTLRGLHLLMARDGDQSPNIGVPEQLGMHAEDAIIASFGGPAVRNDDGKVVKPENADTQVYPYSLLFKRPDAADLRKRFGGAAPAGSKEALANAWGSGAGASAPRQPSTIQRRAQTQGVAPAPSSRPGDERPARDGSSELAPTDLDDEIPF